MPCSPPPLQKSSRRSLCFLAHPAARLLPAQQQNELSKSIRICHTFIGNPRGSPSHCDKPCPYGPVTPNPQQSAPTPSSSAGRTLPMNGCFLLASFNLGRNCLSAKRPFLSLLEVLLCSLSQHLACMLRSALSQPVSCFKGMCVSFLSLCCLKTDAGLV